VVTTNSGSNFSSASRATISMVENCHVPEQNGPSMTLSSFGGIPAVPLTTATTWAALGPAVHRGAGGGPGVRDLVVVARGVVVVGGVYGSVGTVAGGSVTGGSTPVGSVVGTVGSAPGGYADAEPPRLGLPIGSGGAVEGGAGGSPHPASSTSAPTTGIIPRQARRRTSRSTRPW